MVQPIGDDLHRFRGELERAAAGDLVPSAAVASDGDRYSLLRRRHLPEAHPVEEAELRIAPARTRSAAIFSQDKVDHEQLVHQIDSALGLAESIRAKGHNTLMAYLDSQVEVQVNFIIEACRERERIIAHSEELWEGVQGMARPVVNFGHKVVGVAFDTVAGLPEDVVGADLINGAEGVANSISALYQVFSLCTTLGSTSVLITRAAIHTQHRIVLKKLKEHLHKIENPQHRQALADEIQRYEVELKVEADRLRSDGVKLGMAMGLSVYGSVSLMNSIFGFLSGWSSFTLSTFGAAISVSLMAAGFVGDIKASKAIKERDESYSKEFYRPALESVQKLRDKRMERAKTKAAALEETWLVFRDTLLEQVDQAALRRQAQDLGLRLDDLPEWRALLDELEEQDEAHRVRAMRAFFMREDLQERFCAQIQIDLEEVAAAEHTLNRLQGLPTSELKERLSDYGIDLEREGAFVNSKEEAAAALHDSEIRPRLIDKIKRTKEAKALMAKKALTNLGDWKHRFVRKLQRRDTVTAGLTLALGTVAVGIGLTLKLLSVAAIFTAAWFPFMIPGLIFVGLGVATLAVGLYFFYRERPNYMRVVVQGKTSKVLYQKIRIAVLRLRRRMQTKRIMPLAHRMYMLTLQREELRSALEQLRSEETRRHFDASRSGLLAYEAEAELRRLELEARKRAAEVESELKRHREALELTEEAIAQRMERLKEVERHIQTANWRDIMRQLRVKGDDAETYLDSLARGVVEDESLLDHETREILEKYLGIPLESLQKDGKLQYQDIKDQLSIFAGRGNGDVLRMMRSQNLYQRMQREVEEAGEKDE
ncbi:MAG: hypothetical protein KDK78_04195 [Chlamydiia bacterium]|nr:hypothetical protein [Chlamydiia bacterium]